MRSRWSLLVLAVLLIATASHVLGASLFSFDVWMRKVDHRSIDVQHAIAAHDPASAGAAAQDLETLYDQMAQYLDEHDLAAAAALARDDVARAQAIQQRLAQADYEAAEQQAVAITQGCNGCHRRYRPLD